MPDSPEHNTPAGLYLHIPFCIQKCPYCDFYSIAGQSLLEPFVEAMIEEAAIYGKKDMLFDTLYLGGGTPSVLSDASLKRLIDAVNGTFRLAPHSEVTVEVNPGTIDRERLKAFRQMGINRINIGVQSFDDRNLRFLGRIHSAAEAFQSVEAARDAGFDNVGIDLIYALPGQDKSSWQDDLSAATALNPEHLSCYMLTYERGTPLDRQRETGEIRPLADERCAALFELTAAQLGRTGYRHYEVSNFARTKALESRHNRKYWSMAPYIGLGPSAHSFVYPERCWNVASVDAYIDKLAGGRKPIEGSETLNREQQMIEFIYLGLRTLDGIDTAAFARRFEIDFTAAFEPAIETLEQEKLAEVSPGRLHLTLKGLLLLDSVVGLFGRRPTQTI